MKLLGKLPHHLHEQPYLYRIELLDRFFKLLDNKELVFVRPACWTDPLENIIFNAKLIKEGKAFEHPAKNKIYGQCWSYEGDSYALWQIYTTKPDDSGVTKRHPGIRITTHIDRLVQLSALNNGQFYYGLVDYLRKKELDQLKEDGRFIRGLTSLRLNEDHLKTLLVKRYSYHYENEVRLLAVPGQSNIDKTKDVLCRLKIEPVEFISSLRLDPSLTTAEFKKIKQRLIDEYGFAPTRITQSSLSRENNFVFNLDKP